MNDQVLLNQTYADFFVKYLNWAVFENEAKWYANEPERGRITYEKADADGNITCSAFHGTYEIRIHQESQLLKQKTIELDSNEHTPLQLEFIVPVE
nr:endo-1,4-beta-xylanase [Bacillus pumilus]